jgi:hypothetical protein
LWPNPLYIYIIYTKKGIGKIMIKDTNLDKFYIEERLKKVSYVMLNDEINKINESLLIIACNCCYQVKIDKGTHIKPKCIIKQLLKSRKV